MMDAPQPPKPEIVIAAAQSIDEFIKVKQGLSDLLNTAHQILPKFEQNVDSVLHVNAKQENELAEYRKSLKEVLKNHQQIYTSLENLKIALENNNNTVYPYQTCIINLEKTSEKNKFAIDSHKLRIADLQNAFGICDSDLRELKATIKDQKTKNTELEHTNVTLKSQMKFCNTISIMSIVGLSIAFWMWFYTHKA